MLATNHNHHTPATNGHGHGHHGHGHVSAAASASADTNPHSSATSSTNPDCSANYEFLSVIGSGSFGRICKVRRVRDNQVMARKEIDYRRMKEKERRQLVQEVNILRELTHPNIVKYYSRYVDRDSCVINILMEYCEAGDLARVIKEHKQRGRWIDEDVVWTFAAQLVAALHECHFAYAERKRGEGQGSGGNAGGEGGAVLHRDIKPDNVFLDADHNAKLGDFGLSTQCTQHDFARTFVGTPFYMSPELVREQAYNAKSDIWSLGCLVYELCALDPPFRGQTHRQLNDNILKVRYPDLPHAHYSPQLRGLIARMLQLRPDDRPSARDLYGDPQIQAALAAKRARDERGKRERDVARAVEAIAQREAEVGRREADVAVREEAVRAREAAAAQREEHVVAEVRRVEMDIESVRAERARIEGVQQQLAHHEAHLAQVQAQLEAEVQQVREREMQVQRAVQEVQAQQAQVQAAHAQVQANARTPNGFATPSSFMGFQQQRQQQQQLSSTAPRPASASWTQPPQPRAPSTTHRASLSTSAAYSRHTSTQFTPHPQPHVLHPPSSAPGPKYRFANPTFTSTHHSAHHALWTQFRTPAPDAPDLTVDESPTARALEPFDNLHLGSPSERRRATLKRRPDESPDALALAVHADAPSPAPPQAAESARARLVRKPALGGASESNLVHGLAGMALATERHASSSSSPSSSSSRAAVPTARHTAASTRQWTQQRHVVPDSPMPIDSTMADATGIAGAVGGGRTPMSAAAATRKTTGPATWTLTSLPATPVAETPTPLGRAGAGVSKMARQPVFTAAGAAAARSESASAASEFKVPGMPASAMRRGVGAGGGASGEAAAAAGMSTPVAQIRPRLGGAMGSRRSGTGTAAAAAAGSRASGNGFRT